MLKVRTIKSKKQKASENFSSLDPELLSYLTRSLVRLSTNHTEIIANETIQLHRLLANRSLNDDVRVRENFFR